MSIGAKIAIFLYHPTINESNNENFGQVKLGKITGDLFSLKWRPVPVVWAINKMYLQYHNEWQISFTGYTDGGFGSNRPSCLCTNQWRK